MLAQFVLDNFVWIGTLAFASGGVFWSVKNLGGRIDKINGKFTTLDERDRQHERELSDLLTRVAVSEERLQVLDHMTTRIDDIWKHVMRLKD